MALTSLLPFSFYFLALCEVATLHLNLTELVTTILTLPIH